MPVACPCPSSAVPVSARAVGCSCPSAVHTPASHGQRHGGAHAWVCTGRGGHTRRDCTGRPWADLPITKTRTLSVPVSLLGRTMRTGRPTISRRPQWRPSSPLRPPERRALRSNPRRTHPEAQRPLASSPHRRRQMARRRRLATPPNPFSNFPTQPTPTVSQCVNRGRWRCHELQVSALNKNQGGAVRPIPLPTNPVAWTRSANVGVLARTTNAFSIYCDRSLPPVTIRKEYHTHPGPVASYDATRERFPHGFSRIMCPGQSASLYAPRRDRVSHGTSFLRLAL